ncbi:MAG: hypothetical protein ABWZ76_13665 [Acidimicrobiales bacterium]
MLLRALLGFPIVVAAVLVGGWVTRQRADARTPRWRRAARDLHRTTGIVALALLAVLALTAVRLAL